MKKEEVTVLMQNLKPGQCLLVSAAKTVDANKVQLEFAEIIVRKDRPLQAVALLNSTDERFNRGQRARRGWVTVVKEEAKKAFGIDFDKLSYELHEGDRKPVAYIGKFNLALQGRPIHLQVNDTLIPTEWQEQNIHTAAKNNGMGTYYLKDGQPIFSNVTVVAGSPVHRYIDYTESSQDIPSYFNVVEEEENEAIMEEEPMQQIGEGAEG